MQYDLDGGALKQFEPFAFINDGALLHDEHAVKTMEMFNIMSDTNKDMSSECLE